MKTSRVKVGSTTLNRQSLENITLVVRGENSKGKE